MGQTLLIIMQFFSNSLLNLTCLTEKFGDRGSISKMWGIGFDTRFC